MKRFLASALLIGISSFGLVGCDQKTEVKDVKETTTPGGKDKVTTTIKDEKSGDQKVPAPEATKP